MPQIKIISTGEIKTVSEDLADAMIESGRAEIVLNNPSKVISSVEEGDTMVKAYDKLSQGEKDSISKGFKKLVLRKAGWILMDCGNRAMEEIHISLPSRDEQIKDAKTAAAIRLQRRIDMLEKCKGILRKVFAENYDFDVTFDNDEDREAAIDFLDSLSLGSEEVEMLKIKNLELNKKFGVKG